MITDGWGLTGLIMDYSMIVAFSGSTVILFIYFWKKGALNFEEDAKYEMLQEDDK
jgi:hypothetical protein